MADGAQEFERVAETLLLNVKELLASSSPRDRVRGIHHLAVGVGALEKQVLLNAQASGMTWADIGAIYGVSRQAVHRRFADETVVPADYFDALLEDLDGEPDVVPALAQAAKCVGRSAASR